MAGPGTGGRVTLDFFAAEANARRRTAVLVASFALAVAVVIALIYGALLVVAGTAVPAEAVSASPWPVQAELLQPDLLLGTAVGVLAVTGAGTAWHAARLSAQGGDAVALMLGGTPLDRGTVDPAERRLVNVAEEMAIAAGLPVPRLFVLRAETGINAFAAGYTPGHAAVAVTRGALDRLDRDELQGVVAHEISHVLNADTRIDLRLIAAVGGLTTLSLLGRLVLRSQRGSRRGSGAVLLVGLALLVAGAVGSFCGRLVRFAVARQREWLADASAVQFTRNPGGLAGALRTIAAEGSVLASPYAPEAAHLFFARGTGGFLDGLFSTHPPIEERIRRLGAPGAEPVPGARPPRPAPQAAAPAPPAVPEAPARPAAAGLAPTHVAAAAALLERLPPELAQAARQPSGAQAVCAALLLPDAPGARAAQLARLAGGEPALGAEAERLAAGLAGLRRAERLALLGLALPALDDLPPDRAAAFQASLAAPLGAEATAFELAVRRTVLRRLHRDRGAPPRARLRSLDEAGPQCLEVLSGSAWLGSREPAAAQAALDAGVRVLGVRSQWRLLPPERVGLGRLDATLTELDGATPAVKARLLQACSATVAADGRVSAEEAELLRAVSAALGLPMPPAPRADQA